MLADLAQAVIGQRADEFDVRFVFRTGRVLVDALVGIALVLNAPASPQGPLAIDFLV